MEETNYGRGKKVHLECNFVEYYDSYIYKKPPMKLLQMSENALNRICQTDLEVIILEYIPEPFERQWRDPKSVFKTLCMVYVPSEDVYAFYLIKNKQLVAKEELLEFTKHMIDVLSMLPKRMPVRSQRCHRGLEH